MLLLLGAHEDRRYAGISDRTCRVWSSSGSSAGLGLAAGCTRGTLAGLAAVIAGCSVVWALGADAEWSEGIAAFLMGALARRLI